MYDFSVIKTRYYEVKLRSGKFLHVEPPKLKTLRKVENSGKSVDDLAASIALLISKNREHFKVSAADVLETMDIDQCTDFLENFLDWVNGEKASDPN